MSEENRIVTRKGEAKIPKGDAYAIVYQFPTRLEITTMDNSPMKNNKLKRFRRCSGRTYCDTVSGELRNYKMAENRLNSRGSLLKSLKTLGRLINYNFSGHKSELFCTLTYGGEYAGKMYDTEKLYKDFKNFWQRLWYEYSTLEYIAVPEPQDNGSWHIHLLLQDKTRQPLWIENEEMAKIWRHGFVNVKRLTNPQKLVSYFYKGGIPEKIVEDEIFDGADDNESFVADLSRSHENFNRFYRYPPGFNLYRKSDGIHHPVGKRMTYQEARALIPENCQLLNSSTTYVSIVDDNGEVRRLNAITHENYKIPKNSMDRGCK